MRKMFLSALSLAIAGAIASQASAAVTISFQNLGTPLTPTGATNFGNGTALPAMTGWTAYSMTLTSDSGNISAFDFVTDAGNGIFGQLAQYETDTTQTLANVVLPPARQSTLDSHISNTGKVNIFNGDSHFGSAAVLLDSNKSVEDNPLTSSNPSNPLAVASDPGGVGVQGQETYFTVGGSLKGAFGVDSGSQSPSLVVAYLVVPTGTPITASGSVAIAGGPTFVVAGGVNTGAVPEPASLGVLALGGVALLARRRKA